VITQESRKSDLEWLPDQAKPRPPSYRMISRK
jgi:hypothetical protein